MIPPVARRPDRGRLSLSLLSAGGLTGLISGGAMAVFTMIAFASLPGHSFWEPVCLLAGIVTGEPAPDAGFAVDLIVTGLLIQTLVSASLGLCLGAVLRWARLSVSIPAAIGASIGLWIVATAWVGPVVAPLVIARFAPSISLSAHLLFGAVFGWLYPEVRRVWVSG